MGSRDNNPVTLTQGELDAILRAAFPSVRQEDMADHVALILSEQQPVIRREYPDVITEDMTFILGRPNFWCGSLAPLLRADGEEIARKSEAEQAHVIHWLLKLALDHPEDWRKRADDRLTEISKKVAT